MKQGSTKKIFFNKSLSFEPEIISRSRIVHLPSRFCRLSINPVDQWECNGVIKERKKEGFHIPKKSIGLKLGKSVFLLNGSIWTFFFVIWTNI